MHVKRLVLDLLFLIGELVFTRRALSKPITECSNAKLKQMYITFDSQEIALLVWLSEERFHIDVDHSQK